MSATILAKAYAKVRSLAAPDQLTKAINDFPIGRVDVLHVKLYDAKLGTTAVSVTLQIEVGLGSQEPGPHGTERAVAERLRRIVRRITGDKKSEAQALALDNCDWYSTERSES